MGKKQMRGRLMNKAWVNKDKAIRVLTAAFSPSTMFWMMAAWVLYYVTLAVWRDEALGHFMIRLNTDPVHQIPFYGFVIILVVNYLGFFYKKMRTSWRAALVWLVLPTGVVFFILGFLISSVSPQPGRLIVSLGDPVSPPWDKTGYVVDKIDSGLKEEVTDLVTGENLIFNYEPKIYLEGGGIKHEVGVFPPAKVGNTYFHIMDFGLAPGVRIERDGKVLEEGYVIQKILPLGLRDSFEIEPLPYRIAIKLHPIRQVVAGETKLDVYGLVHPVYDVVVQRGQDIVFEGVSSEAIEFDGLVLSFLDPVPWVWLEGGRAFGLPVLVAGILFIIIGLPFTFVGMFLKLMRSFRHDPYTDEAR